MGAHQVDEADVEVLVRLHHSVGGSNRGACCSGCRTRWTVVVVGGGAVGVSLLVLAAVVVAAAAR